MFHSEAQGLTSERGDRTARRVTRPSGALASAMWTEISFRLGSTHLGWLDLYASSVCLMPEKGEFVEDFKVAFC